MGSVFIMMPANKRLQANASLLLFWATFVVALVSLSEAFQATSRHITHTSYARAGRSNPLITRQSIPSDDAQESMLPDDIIEAYPLASSHDSMTARDVVVACMDALLQNDSPSKDFGLEVCFNFSSDRCRASMGGDLEAFITFAHNPTFGFLANASDYSILNVGPEIPGSATRGSMQTVLVRLTPEEGGDRTYLWTMQQERRPPRQGLWLVHECIFVENAFALTE